MQNDFSQGKVWKNIIRQAIPLVLAQLVFMLYNVVDRIYIGHLPGANSLALTGIGLAFPLTTFIAAVTNLFGSGGAPLFAIARVSGWCAHRIEEIVSGGKIIRPAYKSVSKKREYIPIEDR